jgi:hypothetical protein
MSTKVARYAIATFLALAFFSLSALAQQAGDVKPQQASLPVGPASASPATAAANSSGELTEREKLLLDRIEKLERRLEEVESRTAGKPAEVVARVPSAVNPRTTPPLTPLEASIRKAAEESPADAAAPADAATPPPSTITTVAQVPALPGPCDVRRRSEKKEPFAFADFTWLTGNPRNKDTPLDTTFFTPEIRADVEYTDSLSHPKDDSIGGSSEIFRSGEVQLTQLGLGGDFHCHNVRARFMTQFGMYAITTPRNDASPGRGQWDLDTAYRYISEAYGGYHIDKLNGINIDAGIFMSYIGLFSYYQADNWAYQPSYVSSNTPWFFNGVRIQFFVSDKLKIEPWIINGWQSYGKFNNAPGVGGQILWRPTGSVSFVSNNYWGTDTLGIPGRKRVHTDNSIQVKYYDNPNGFISKMASTLTIDAGCEYGVNAGVSCHGEPNAPAQYFLGFMQYDRVWFDHDLFAFTAGGGAITNPGRYLVLLPPINGATAFSGTPYFPESPGDQFRAWDVSGTFDYMPSQYITFRSEFNHRASSVPYFTGAGGITPPGGNTGLPGSVVTGWFPDLSKHENRFTLAILVKF